MLLVFPLSCLLVIVSVVGFFWVGEFVFNASPFTFNPTQCHSILYRSWDIHSILTYTRNRKTTHHTTVFNYLHSIVWKVIRENWCGWLWLSLCTAGGEPNEESQEGREKLTKRNYSNGASLLIQTTNIHNHTVIIAIEQNRSATNHIQFFHSHHLASHPIHLFSTFSPYPSFPLCVPFVYFSSSYPLWLRLSLS